MAPEKDGRANFGTRELVSKVFQEVEAGGSQWLRTDFLTAPKHSMALPYMLTLGWFWGVNVVIYGIHGMYGALIRSCLLAHSLQVDECFRHIRISHGSPVA